MKVPDYYRTEFEGFFADIYDAFFSLATFFQVEKLRKKAINILGLKKEDSVIEFACGTGSMSILLAKEIGEKGKVIGIDLSQRMLNIAIKKSKPFNNISYERRNFEHVPYKNTFDAAVISFGAHEVPPEPRLNLYKQAYKALKPKAKLLLFDYASPKGMLLKPLYWLYMKTIEHPNGWEFVNEDHEKLLEENGFHLIKKQRMFYLFEASVYQKV
jgi:demethylmenaquinone methyltransferase/2-methoxy-6-polyprenyl-1,4-benzoquinol methylase